MSGHTYTHTYTQDNYSNPRCACAPRVNEQKVGMLLQKEQVKSMDKSMDDNCGEWVECWVWLVSVVSRRQVWLVGVGE